MTKRNENEQFKKGGMEDIAEHLDEYLIGLDDTFTFHCTQCGKCCVNREDILLNALDIYRIAKELHLTPREFIKKYCESYIGHNSKMQIVRLLPLGPFKICPMLNRDGRCNVHRVKPTVCATFPLGRVARVDKESGAISEPLFIFNDPDCGDHTETHTPREWLGSFGIPVKDDFFGAWQSLMISGSKIMTALAQQTERGSRNHRQRMKALIENVESFTFDIMYTRYDTKKPFMEQFFENKQMFHDRMEQLKQLIAN